MEILLIYGGVLAVLVTVGVLLYLRSAVSRKGYTCPQCGEHITVELMEAGRCNVCGAALEREG